MEKCIICGGLTKFDPYDFCEKCFNSSIKEIEKYYLGKRASQTHEDHQEAQPTGDSFESCQSKSFYHRLERTVKRIFQGERLST